MKKFTKGLLTGLGTGIVAGIGTSVMLLVITERESIRVEKEIQGTMEDLVEYLKTEEGQQNKHLFGGLVQDLTSLGEIRISKTFKNLAKAMELKSTSKEYLKAISDETL